MSRAAIGQLLDPRWGRIGTASWVRDPRRTLLLIGHEQESRDQQRSVYELVEYLLERRTDVPVLLEGFAGPRPGRSLAPIRDRERRLATAAAAIEQDGRFAPELLVHLHPGPAPLHGIDDPALLAAQREQADAIEQTLRSSLPEGVKDLECDPFLAALADALASLVHEVEALAFGSRLRELRAARDRFRETGKVLEYGRALASRAADAGVRLDAYPALEALLDAASREHTLDFTAAERERQALIEELTRRSDAPLTAVQAQAVEAWLAGLAPEERELLAQHGAASAASAAPAERSGWLRRLFGKRPAPAPASAASGDAPETDWLAALVALSLGLREHRISYSRYSERLDDLVEALEVHLPRPANLRRYTDYVILTESVDSLELMAELEELGDELLDRAVASAAEYGILELRRRLDDMILLLRRRLPAGQARSVLASRPGAVEWLRDLLRLGETLDGDLWDRDEALRQTCRLAALATPILDRLLPLVSDLYFYAVCRSARLLERALSFGADGTAVVAIVCGRFHLHEMQRILRSESDLSWAVVVPASRPPAGSFQAGNWGWALPWEEHVSVPPRSLFPEQKGLPGFSTPRDPDRR